MDPRTAYREAEVRGASPVRQVVLLYDQLIQDLGRAIRAMERSDVETRTREINHAVCVVGFLQSKLNMAAGGEVARNLDTFYNSLRSRLLEAQIRVSKAILTQQITDLLSLREAWVEVEKAETRTLATADRASTGSSENPKLTADWKG
jgi:flagellar protein FliS